VGVRPARCGQLPVGPADTAPDAGRADTSSKDGSGGSFMPCHKEGQAFGHHLLIAHVVPIFVSGLQQDGEEIIPLYRMIAPLVNKAPNAMA